MKAVLFIIGLSVALGACKKDVDEPILLDGQWELQESVRTDYLTGNGGPVTIFPDYDHRLNIKGDSVRVYYSIGNRSALLLLRNGNELHHPRGGMHSTIKELGVHRLVLHYIAPYQAAGIIGQQNINDLYTR